MFWVFYILILYEHNQPISNGQTPTPELLNETRKKKETERNGKGGVVVFGLLQYQNKGDCPKTI
jgi:hypothetical protein